MNEDEFTPTPDEKDALRGIAANAHEEPTPKIKTSQRLLDHGYVKKNDEGVLELTVRGKRLMRAP